MPPGADVIARTGGVHHAGMTPLHLVNTKYNDLNDPSTHVSWCDELILHACLEKGLNVDSRNREGVTPLHMACQGLNLPFVRIFVEYGADVNTADDLSITPLMYCLICVTPIRTRSHRDVGNLKIKECIAVMDYLILSCGADVHIKTLRNETLLHSAARCSDMVEYLANKDIDVNVRDDLQRTCLHRMCWEGSAKDHVIRMLVARGAGIYVSV